MTSAPAIRDPLARRLIYGVLALGFATVLVVHLFLWLYPPTPQPQLRDEVVSIITEGRYELGARSDLEPSAGGSGPFVSQLNDSARRKQFAEVLRHAVIEGDRIITGVLAGSLAVRTSDVILKFEFYPGHIGDQQLSEKGPYVVIWAQGKVHGQLTLRIPRAAFDAMHQS